MVAETAYVKEGVSDEGMFRGRAVYRQLSSTSSIDTI